MSIVDCTGDEGDKPCVSPEGSPQKCEDSICYATDGIGVCIEEEPVKDICSTTAAQALRGNCTDWKLRVPNSYETLISMSYLLVGKAGQNKDADHFGAVVHPNIEPGRTRYYSKADNIQYLMVNLTSKHAPGIYLNQQSNILLRQKGKMGRIVTWNNPMPLTAKEVAERSLGAAFFVPWAVMIGFGFVNILTVSEVVKEKQKDLKATQFISGVRNFPYWISMYTLDVTMTLFAAVLIFFLLFIFDVYHLTGTQFDQLSVTIISFLSFSFAQPPFGLLISNLFSDSTTSLFSTFAMNMLIVPLFFIMIFLCELFLLAIPEDPITSLNTLVAVLHWIFRFMPVYNVGDTLLQTVMLSLFF